MNIGRDCLFARAHPWKLGRGAGFFFIFLFLVPIKTKPGYNAGGTLFSPHHLR